MNIPKASALYWFPKIEAAGLPVPDTKFFPYDHSQMLSLFDGEESAEFVRLAREIQDYTADGRKYFLRSDLSSAKHGGPKSYLIEHGAPADQIFATLEDNEMKFFMGPDTPQAMMVRQFLELPAPFTAFDGLPISREWRFFASACGVQCFHPYWPEDALEGSANAEGWREQLVSMHEIPAEIDKLKEMAITAATACTDVGGPQNPVWSVDFAQDADGKWWLLDMAPGEQSWHWPGCGHK